MRPQLLSDILDSTMCPASQSRVPDDFFSVGCVMVGSQVPGKDAGAQADFMRQGQGILVDRKFLKPHRPGDGIKDEYNIFGTDKVVVNDLFVPGARVDEDGFMHIHFPVPVWTPLTSSFLGRDWRFVALAWIAVVDAKIAPTKMIFTAFDSAGRRVMAMVEPDVLDAFKTMLKVDRRNVEVPGAACARCVKAEVCEGLQRILDPFMDNVTTPLPKDKAMVAEAIFYQRMELETRIEILEEKKRKADQLLQKLSVDGYIRIGSESIQLPSRKGHQWDYARSYRVLQPAGLWRDVFASINISAIQTAMEEFPSEIKKKLLDAVVETTVQPSISEAVKHGRTVKTTLLRGLTKVR